MPNQKIPHLNRTRGGAKTCRSRLSGRDAVLKGTKKGKCTDFDKVSELHEEKKVHPSKSRKANAKKKKNPRQS